MPAGTLFDTSLLCNVSLWWFVAVCDKR